MLAWDRGRHQLCTVVFNLLPCRGSLLWIWTLNSNGLDLKKLSSMSEETLRILDRWRVCFDLFWVLNTYINTNPRGFLPISSWWINRPRLWRLRGTEAPRRQAGWAQSRGRQGGLRAVATKTTGRKRLGERLARKVAKWNKHEIWMKSRSKFSEFGWNLDFWWTWWDWWNHAGETIFELQSCDISLTKLL